MSGTGNRYKDDNLSFPWAEPPGFGAFQEIAAGLLWLRLPLPYRLDHINVYLLEDQGGWAAVDAGLGDAVSRGMWEALLAGPLAGQRLTRLFVTHFHPDHVGLAGWLTEQFNIPVHMPRSEYLYSLALQYSPPDRGNDLYRAFYRAHGLSEDVIDSVLSRGHEYLRQTTGVPSVFHCLNHGQELRVGRRVFHVLTGGGHAMEQAMFYCAQERLFLAADQVIARISPNIGVYPLEPEADSLKTYLDSLRLLRETIPANVLVLPAHGLPFHGLHARAQALIAHHAERCALVRLACQAALLSAADLIPVLFPRPLDPHQTGFAFGEVLAHVNYMLTRGELRGLKDESGIQRYLAA